MRLPPTSGAPARLTPGAISTTAHRSRPRGISLSVSLVKVAAVPVAVRSTTGLWPLTVTDSVRVPMAILASMRAVKPMVSRTSSRTKLLKPASSKLTRKVPAGSSPKRYVPSVPVTALSSGTCSAGLVRLTVTPGIAASLSSVTTP